MDYAEHVEATKRELAAFQAAMRDGPMGAPVPSCPDWMVADLSRHVGEFMGFWIHVICEATGQPKPDLGEPPGFEGIADWFDAIAPQLIAHLEATPSDTEVWTWVADNKTQSFIGRRCAHELAIHRFDAQLARSAPQPIDAALAADGIEEIFDMIANRPRPADAARDGETLHLHGTDEDRQNEWLVTMGADGLDVRREHAKGDLAIRASVSDLELLLYGRPPLGPVERFGDAAVLEAWGRTFHFG